MFSISGTTHWLQTNSLVMFVSPLGLVLAVLLLALLAALALVLALTLAHSAPMFFLLPLTSSLPDPLISTFALTAATGTI